EHGCEAGRGSGFPSTQRYSMVKLCPSIAELAQSLEEMREPMVLVSDKPSICLELYKLAIHILGLAVVIRLFHACQHDILLRGEPHDYMGFDHRLILPRR